MTYRILLVEDHVQICEMICDYFSAQHACICVIDTVQNGTDGLAAAQSGAYDLILLDVMLPDLDGFSVCRSIRAVSDVPLVFLTARAREEDVLYGYTLGCDDYVVKPFSLATLYAKVQALLKRAKGTVLRRELVCGKITLNPLTLAVTADGQPVTLPAKEFALLQYLMEHREWVVSRDQLLDRIWGSDFFGSDRVVDTHIKKLRKALGSAGRQIHTVISRGYQLKDHV
ncbi:MAG: response regulator transcription factor [Oscillospiraceae bacterium]|nr:response regulator transcription factor [Oscillospiraceae bacterium]